MCVCVCVCVCEEFICSAEFIIVLKMLMKINAYKTKKKKKTCKPTKIWKCTSIAKDGLNNTSGFSITDHLMNNLNCSYKIGVKAFFIQSQANLLVI